MSKYTLNDFFQLLDTIVKGNGRRPPEVVLPAQEYIELLQDCWQSVLPPTSTPPTPLEFKCLGVVVIPCIIGVARFSSWDDILTAYGHTYATSNPISHLGGYMQLDIGPWRYAVPLHRTSSFPAIAQLLTPVSNLDADYVASLIPGSTHEPSNAQEPPCLCSSRSLVTIGHEQGCRWLHWKSMGGVK